MIEVVFRRSSALVDYEQLPSLLDFTDLTLGLSAVFMTVSSRPP